MKQFNLILEKTSYYLLLLLPISLITGPFIPDLTAVLISIFVLINFKSILNYNLFNKKIFLLLITFNVWIIISSLTSDHTLFSLKSSIFYFRFLTFSLGIYYFINLDSKFSLKFFYILLFAFFMLILDGYFQFLSGSNTFGYNLQPGPRVSSFFDEELILGSYLSRLLPLLFGLYLYNINNFSNKKKIISFLVALTLILSECLVFLSGERAAFFFINLSAFFMIIFLRGYKLLRLFTLTISFILIFIIINYQPNAKNRILDLTLEQTAIFEKDTKTIIFSKIHENYYKTALNIYKSNFVLGTGPKTFRKNCSNPKYSTSELSCSTHPHNTYIQLLSETGSIGFILIMLLFLSIIKFSLYEIFFRKNNNKLNSEYNFKVCLISCFLITLWPFIPTGNFFNNWLNIIYYLPLGFFIPLIYRDIKKKFN